MVAGHCQQIGVAAAQNHRRQKTHKPLDQVETAHSSVPRRKEQTACCSPVDGAQECPPCVWDIACVVSQDGIHHGRNKAVYHQAKLLTLVYEGLNQFQGDLHVCGKISWLFMRRECPAQLAASAEAFLNLLPKAQTTLRMPMLQNGACAMTHACADQNHACNC